MLKPKKKLTRREIKEDKFLTFVAKATKWFNENSKYIAIALAALVVAVAVGYLIVSSKHQAETAASGRLIRAMAAYNNMAFDRAIPILQGIVDQFPGTKSAGIAAFYLGRAYYNKENYEEAKKYFSLYVEKYGDDPLLKSAALAGLGACYAQQGDKEMAAQYYEKAAKKEKEFFNAADYLFSAAENYAEIGKIGKAQELLQLVLEKYPQTPVANDAKMLLAELTARAA